MLILTGKVPQIGEIYLPTGQVWVSVKETHDSFSASNELIDLFVPGPQVTQTDQLLLLEKDLSQNVILGVDERYTASDYLVYKFLLIKSQQVVYWKAAPVILSDVSTSKDIRLRAAHQFSFMFRSLKDFVEAQRKT